MQKKEKLWDRGNIMSWELSKEDYEFSDIGALLTDKEIAFEKMCFKETKALELMHAEL